MDKFKHASGMSLIEVLIVVSILGFVSLMVASTFTDIFKLQTQMVGRDESNEFSGSVARFLFSDSTCTLALAGQAFPTATGVNLPITLPGYLGFAAGARNDADPASVADGGPMTLMTNQNVTQRLHINELTIANKGMPAQDVLTGGATLKRYLAQVNLSMGVLNDGKLRSPPPRSFEFPVLVDPVTNLIKRCYMDMQVEDACNVLGTTFDPATGKCTPQTQCIFEGYYSVNTCNPSVASCPAAIVNSLTGAASCPHGVSTAKQTGQYDWSYTQSCGKKCTETINVNSKYYICLRCT